ncbi:MAG: hypothetical protein SGCHY_005329, partial [Lobulomycetales sp.]
QYPADYDTLVSGFVDRVTSLPRWYVPPGQEDDADAAHSSDSRKFFMISEREWYKSACACARSMADRQALSNSQAQARPGGKRAGSASFRGKRRK